MVTHSTTGYHGYSLYYRLPWLLTLLQVTMVTHSTTGYHGYSLHYGLPWLLTQLQVTMVIHSTTGYHDHFRLRPPQSYDELRTIILYSVQFAWYSTAYGNVRPHWKTSEYCYFQVIVASICFVLLSDYIFY